MSRVVSLEPRSRGRRALVTWHRRVINQQDQTVQEGLTQTLVRGRAQLAKEESSVTSSQ